MSSIVANPLGLAGEVEKGAEELESHPLSRPDSLALQIIQMRQSGLDTVYDQIMRDFIKPAEEKPVDLSLTTDARYITLASGRWPRHVTRSSFSDEGTIIFAEYDIRNTCTVVTGNMHTQEITAWDMVHVYHRNSPWHKHLEIALRKKSDAEAPTEELSVAAIRNAPQLKLQLTKNRPDLFQGEHLHGIYEFQERIDALEDLYRCAASTVLSTEITPNQT